MASGSGPRRRITVRDLSKDYIYHRRRLNYGVGEVKVDHPNVLAVDSWDLRRVLQGAGQTGLPVPTKHYYRPRIVDSDETFTSMMAALGTVQEVTVDIECTQKLSYLDEMVWLQIGTLERDFIVDFFQLSNDHMAQLREYLAHENRVVIMFACSNDVIFLRRSCGIFLTGVVDIQSYWVQKKGLKQLPRYRTVMEAILGREVAWTGEKKVMQRSDFLLRPPTVLQLKYMQEDVHYLYQAWLVLKSTVTRKELQEFGVYPIKKRVAAVDYIADRTVSFNDDLAFYMTQHSSRPLSPAVKQKAQIMWEYRKYLAMIHNWLPQDVCPMAQIVWMAVASPEYHWDLEEGLKNHVKAESPIWTRTKKCVELLEQGMTKWEQLACVECFYCGNFGHMYLQCYRPKKQVDYARYLSKHAVPLSRKRGKSWEGWKKHCVKVGLPPDTKPPRNVRLEDKVWTADSNADDGSEIFEGQEPFLLPPRHMSLEAGAPLQNRPSRSSAPTTSGANTAAMSYAEWDYNVPAAGKVAEYDEESSEEDDLDDWM